MSPYNIIIYANSKIHSKMTFNADRVRFYASSCEINIENCVYNIFYKMRAGCIKAKATAAFNPRYMVRIQLVAVRRCFFWPNWTYQYFISSLTRRELLPFRFVICVMCVASLGNIWPPHDPSSAKKHTRNPVMDNGQYMVCRCARAHACICRNRPHRTNSCLSNLKKHQECCAGRIVRR